jgi:UV DNA damage endonuclease
MILIKKSADSTGEIFDGITDLKQICWFSRRVKEAVMVRFGLCCIFKEEPIRFRQTTAKYLSGFPREEQLRRLSEICLANAVSLMRALEFCHANGIGDFRINSQILPLKTHPQAGYDIMELPDADKIVDSFKACGQFCRVHSIRTTFHPDQFIVLSSPHPHVVKHAIAELEYQAEVATWVNADVINIHAGGVYGDKKTALKRLRNQIEGLSDSVRKWVTLENDDRSYTPVDLLPVCTDMEVPLVYDVHHHRCCPDGLSIERVTGEAIKTWEARKNSTEPLFHISSPIHGWQERDMRKHHDYIDINDFPMEWLACDLTVEVEAKAKEKAVLALMGRLRHYQFKNHQQRINL